jgi:phosphonoacetaldehyde hydrolase
MGVNKKDQIRAMLQTPAVTAKWRGAVGRDWTADDIDELYRIVTPLLVEAAAAHSALVPGLLDAVAWLRGRGIKVGATTGYFREAAEACYTAAKQQGYKPDYTICGDEVPAGRPAPWMMFRVMETLSVYPPTTVVKIGDTIADIEEGLNAGAWAVGIVDSSSGMGLTEAELTALPPDEREARREELRTAFLDAGADAVIDDYTDLPDLIDALNQQLG